MAELFDDGAPVNHDLLRQFATANRDAIKMTKEKTLSDSIHNIHMREIVGFLQFLPVSFRYISLAPSFFSFFGCLASGNCQFGHVKEDFEANLDASFTP